MPHACILHLILTSAFDVGAANTKQPAARALDPPRVSCRGVPLPGRRVTGVGAWLWPRPAFIGVQWLPRASDQLPLTMHALHRQACTLLACTLCAVGNTGGHLGPEVRKGPTGRPRGSMGVRGGRGSWGGGAAQPPGAGHAPAARRARPLTAGKASAVNAPRPPARGTGGAKAGDGNRGVGPWQVMQTGRVPPARSRCLAREARAAAARGRARGEGGVVSGI